MIARFLQVVPRDGRLLLNCLRRLRPRFWFLMPLLNENRWGWASDVSSQRGPLLPSSSVLDIHWLTVKFVPRTLIFAAGSVLLSILQIFNEVFHFMFTEKVVLKPHDVSVFTTLSVNGRLFACPRDQFDSLVCMYAVLRKFSSSVNLNAWYFLYYQCFG